LEPAWLVRAGTWPTHFRPVEMPRPSATGLPLAALGLVRGRGDAQSWSALQSTTGGAIPEASTLPPPASVYLEGPIVARLVERLCAGGDLLAALLAELRSGGIRLVRCATLDVFDDERLRVLQVVTSFQRGGAERVTLDLAHDLVRRQVCCRCVGIGRPGRAPFPTPSGTIDLSGLPRDDRQAALARVVQAFAADVVHGHLLNRDECIQLAALGVPLVLTVHNMAPGWPAGLEELRQGEAHLLLACSGAVEADLRAAGVQVPVRTVWNGIDCSSFQPGTAPGEAGRRWREQFEFATEDFVIVSLANPRRQKGLHRLPAILAATREELARRGAARQARLVLAGAPSPSPEAMRVVEEARREFERLGLAEHVRWTGSVEDVAGLLSASDVLVSTSLHEGLSLAQVEALATGRAVVATDVGGVAELAHGNPAVIRLPRDAAPECFAHALAEVALWPPPDGRAVAARHFTRARMAERYRWFYPRAIHLARPHRPATGLWLVINNFSTGGAQSSARRLLTGLASQGVPVRATVLQEQPDRPTAGRKALLAAGVPVSALPPPGTLDAAEAVALLLEEMAQSPPKAVLLWNVITQYKILLADGLIDVPLFDVSPGEMYFSSLERYFDAPRPGLPYLGPANYGKRLAGLIVKYRAEVERAAVLGAPVHVIPNGVPLPEVVSPARSPGDRLILGTLVRLSPQKKLGDLLAALRHARDRLPSHVLRIAGGVEAGAEAHVEELRASAEGLDVEWLGGLNDPGLFLHGLDLFVLVAEPAGCPNASLEALAAGLPVIVTDVGGAAEQVIDGVTGRLVPRGDIPALAEALVEMARDPCLRARLAEAGRAHVAARFGIARMVADYRRVCLDGLL
jgi:glycosyltransferase involved in cell wall biosynthesis